MTRPAIINSMLDNLDLILTSFFFIITMSYLALNGMGNALYTGGIMAALYLAVRLRK